MLLMFIPFLLLSLVSPVVASQDLSNSAVRSSFQGESRAHELVKNIYNNARTAICDDSRLILRASDDRSAIEIDALPGGIWTHLSERIQVVSRSWRETVQCPRKV